MKKNGQSDERLARQRRAYRVRALLLLSVPMALLCVSMIFELQVLWQVEAGRGDPFPPLVGALVLAVASFVSMVWARRSLNKSRRSYYADAEQEIRLDERMSTVIVQLGDLSRQLGPLIQEARSLSRQAAQKAAKIENLESQEAALRQEVSELRGMSKGQADAVARLISEAEGRSREQDRLYFLLGVAATIAVSVAVLLVGRLLA